MGDANLKIRLFTLVTRSHDLEYGITEIMNRRMVLTQESMNLEEQNTKYVSSLMQSNPQNVNPDPTKLTLDNSAFTAAYDSQKAAIALKDKSFETQEKSLDIADKEVTTEQKSVETMIDKNVKDSYSTFGGK